MEKYPALAFLLKWGSALPGIVAAVIVLGTPALFGLQAGPVIAGVVIGGAMFVVVKSYIELVGLITDMLLPK